MRRDTGESPATGPVFQSARPQLAMWDGSFVSGAGQAYGSVTDQVTPGFSSGRPQYRFAPNYEVPTAPNYETAAPPTAPKLEATPTPAKVSAKSFDKWPEIVTPEDFQVQALEREILNAQEQHLDQRLELMERLIQPRAFDTLGEFKYDTRKFEYMCYPYEVRDPNYTMEYRPLYIQKDKVMQREHQLAEFHRRLEHHPLIYSMAGVRQHAEKDFISSANFIEMGPHGERVERPVQAHQLVAQELK